MLPYEENNKFILLFVDVAGAISWATPYNIAPQARVSASSSIDAGHDAAKVTDGLIRVPGKGEWVSKSTETFWGTDRLSLDTVGLGTPREYQ